MHFVDKRDDYDSESGIYLIRLSYAPDIKRRQCNLKRKHGECLDVPAPDNPQSIADERE